MKNIMHIIQLTLALPISHSLFYFVMSFSYVAFCSSKYTKVILVSDLHVHCFKIVHCIYIRRFVCLTVIMETFNRVIWVKMIITQPFVFLKLPLMIMWPVGGGILQSKQSLGAMIWTNLVKIFYISCIINTLALGLMVPFVFWQIKFSYSLPWQPQILTNSYFVVWQGNTQRSLLQSLVAIGQVGCVVKKNVKWHFTTHNRHRKTAKAHPECIVLCWIHRNTTHSDWNNDITIVI